MAGSSNVSSHEERRNQRIESLELSKSLTALLRDNGIRSVGQADDRVRDSSIVEINGIGGNRADLIEQALRRQFGPRWQQKLLKVARSTIFSILLILAVTAIVLSIGNTKFNSGEISILLIVTASLAAYELGRWIPHCQSERNTPLTVGRARILVALIAAMTGYVTESDELDPSPLFDGIITIQAAKIFLLGVLFFAWEAIRQYRRATRIHVWLSRRPAPVPVRGWLDRFTDRPPIVQAAIIGAVGAVLAALIGESSELIHLIKSISFTL